MGASFWPSPTSVGVRHVTRYFMTAALPAESESPARNPARYTGCGKSSGATSVAAPRGSTEATMHRAFRHHARGLLVIAPADRFRRARRAWSANSFRAANRRNRRARDETETASTRPVSPRCSASRREADLADALEISGISRDPSRCERSPPNPESASRRSAAVTGPFHCSRAIHRRETPRRIHRPASGANSRHAVECGGNARSPSRSTAALDRTETRNGPCAPCGTRHSLAPSTVQASSEIRAAVNQVIDDAERHEPRAFPAHLGRGGGGHRVRGGTTNSVIALNGKQELKRTAGLRRARGRIQPFFEHAQRAPSRWKRRSRANRCDRCDPRGRDRPNRGRCARARWAAERIAGLKDRQA